MTVTPIPHENGRFWVSSRSRPGLDHVVDLAYKDEPYKKPMQVCSCEAFCANRATKGKTCAHIRRVLEHLKSFYGKKGTQ